MCFLSNYYLGLCLPLAYDNSNMLHEHETLKYQNLKCAHVKEQNSTE